MSLSWKFAHNLRLKVFFGFISHSHTLSLSLSHGLSAILNPQDPVRNPNLNRLTHTLRLQNRANVYIIWTTVAVALLSLSLFLSVPLSLSQSRHLFWSLSAKCRCNVWTTLDWRCFTLFLLLLLLLPPLLLRASVPFFALYFTFVSADALLFCFMANVFASLGSAIKHGAWPGRVCIVCWLDWEEEKEGVVGGCSAALGVK